MRTKITLLLFAAFTLHLNSQNWCPPGATWHFGATHLGPWSIFYEDLVYELKYTGNVQIDSTSCQRIEARYKWRYGASTYTEGTYGVFDTYVSNNVLYVYKGAGLFDTVVNFNASVGDSWLNRYCSKVYALTVIDTGRAAIANLSLKTITVKSQDSTVYKFAERIMHLGGNPFFYYCLPDSPVEDYYSMHPGFRCYQDNQLFYGHKPASNCFDLAITGLDEQILSSFSIYPNPVGDKLVVEIESPSEGIVFELSDMSGRILLCQSLSNSGSPNLDVSKLVAGVYLLTIKNKGRRLITKKVIKE
jgi:hypothetical protein